MSSLLPINDAKLVNSMEIAFQYHVAPFKKNLKKAFEVNICLTLFCCNFKFVVINTFFFLLPQICTPKFKSSQKKFFSSRLESSLRPDPLKPVVWCGYKHRLNHLRPSGKILWSLYRAPCSDHFFRLNCQRSVCLRFSTFLIL